MKRFLTEYSNWNPALSAYAKPLEVSMHTDDLHDTHVSDVRTTVPSVEKCPRGVIP